MKTRYISLGMVTGLICTLLVVSNATAMPSVTMAPLQYQSQLQKNEVKKGFVDIGNPGNETITMQLQVQAFRQTDDNGSLEFYTDPAYQKAIKLDIETIELKSKEGMRVYFLIDGTKLPKGDVFATIMASTVPKATTGAAQSARVGTLLIINNDGTGARQAEITQFSVPWLQVGSGIEAQLSVKNTVNTKDKNTGFFPDVIVTTQPYGSKTVQGPLLFAGRTRAINYSQPGDYFGPIYLKAKVLSSEQGKWIFAVTGYWRWLIPIIIGFIVLGFWLRSRLGLFSGRTKGAKRSYRIRR